MGKTFRRDSDGHSWERESNKIKRVKKEKQKEKKLNINKLKDEELLDKEDYDSRNDTR